MRAKTQIAIALLIGLSCGTLHAQDTPENRMSVASKLAEFELARVFGEDAIRELSRAVPPPAQKDFMQFLSSPDHRKAIARALATVAAQTFTLSELEALLAFNSSAIGQSINAKQAAYTRRSVEAMNREIRPIFDEFMKSRK